MIIDCPREISTQTTGEIQDMKHQRQCKQTETNTLFLEFLNKKNCAGKFKIRTDVTNFLK